jgi:serine protease Do
VMNFRKKIAAPFIIALCMITMPSISIAKGAPESFADLSEKLLPAVVNVYTTQNIKVDNNRSNRNSPFPPGSPFEDFFKRFQPPEDQNNDDNSNSRPRVQKRQSLGSGFIIDASGIIVTNYHVIKDADEVSIKLHDGTEIDAKIIGQDDKLDLAILQVETKIKLTAVKFGDDSKTRVGDWVLAVGNPYGLGASVTAGILSARNRDIQSGPYDDYLQTDASINRGNSGGPMFNMDGEVIGINTAIYSPTGGNIGIGFAIPSNQAVKVIDQLREYGRAKRGRIGVRISTVSEDIAESLGMAEATGAMVELVEENSPSSKAGVQFGDIIIEFDGQAIKTQRELPTVVANTPIGKTVKMVVLRKGEKVNLSITVEELKDETEDEDDFSDSNDTPADEAQETVLGLSLKNLDDQTRTELEIDEDVNGVLITGVNYNAGPEELRRLRRGDIIIEITQQEVASIEQVKARVEELKKAGRKVILLSINRRGTMAHVPLKIEEDD